MTLKEEVERKIRALQRGVEADGIRRIGCPVCGVRHRSGRVCKDLVLEGLQHLITTKKPKEAGS